MSAELSHSFIIVAGRPAFFLFPNLKREAEAGGCAMSAEKVRKKKEKGKVCDCEFSWICFCLFWNHVLEFWVGFLLLKGLFSLNLGCIYFRTCLSTL